MTDSGARHAKFRRELRDGGACVPPQHRNQTSIDLIDHFETPTFQFGNQTYQIDQFTG